MLFRALSIQQPWAELILAGRKCVENRSWPTRYRGTLAIHASRGLAHWTQLSDAQRSEFWPSWPASGPPPLGCVVGLVELLGVCRYADLPAELAGHPFASADTANWCWVLARPRRLRSAHPAKGLRALFSVDIPEELLPSETTPAQAEGG